MALKKYILCIIVLRSSRSLKALTLYHMLTSDGGVAMVDSLMSCLETEQGYVL